ncbi:HNH endonuclease [Cytobacillus oceanisediminis]|uniref:HNH endonuclease n=1 Tax=Cytobacillus oceanisediminis TaxID=665099 RepID=UPI0037360033
MIIRKCDCCEKEFKQYPSRAYRSKNNFCSKECSGIYRRHYSSRKFAIEYEEDENGCFICTSHKIGKRGYPRMHEKLVFRHVYEQIFEPLNEGDLIRHLCDNKLCINPEHLRKGTQLENMRDAMRNGKVPKGSQKPNAKYDELQIYGVKILIQNTDLNNVEIEHITQVNKEIISRVRNGKTWTHVGVS